MKRDLLRCMAGAAAGVLFTGTSTFAADLGVAPLAPLPVFTWTGFELGAQVGGGTGRTAVNIDGNPAAVPPAGPASVSYSDSGVFGGIHLGLNYQLTGPIVVGVQGEYNFAGITGNASAPPLDFVSTSIRQFGSADGRIGVAFNRLLIYAIGGFAYGDIRNTIICSCGRLGLGGFPVNRDFASNRYGFDVGGGLEYNFYGNWTVRAEYRYYDWGTRSFTDEGFTSPLSIGIPIHTSRETLHTGRIGLTYKFGWPFASPVVARY
jgi:outer membrane immunogenic protein